MLSGGKNVRQNSLMTMTGLKRRDLMGDKGGKKDKEKGQKQNTEKQKQDSQKKIDKQPKRTPNR